MGSDPGQATPEKGGELVAAAVAGLIEDVAAFSAEEMPTLSKFLPQRGARLEGGGSRRSRET